MDKKILIVISVTVVGILVYQYYENNIKKSIAGRVLGL